MWNVEWEQETDGRWIAEIPDISGVMAYGTTKDEALRNVEILALKILTERLERGEEVKGIRDLFHTV
ncbi:MAG: type II toxin-antitoxin system HicB family antitoxin [Leptospirillum sp.]